MGQPRMVPHALPDQAGLTTLIRDLPLRLRTLRDEPHLYLALLQVRARACILTGCLLDGMEIYGPSMNWPEHLSRHLLALQLTRRWSSCAVF